MSSKLLCFSNLVHFEIECFLMSKEENWKRTCVVHLSQVTLRSGSAQIGTLSPGLNLTEAKSSADSPEDSRRESCSRPHTKKLSSYNGGPSSSSLVEN